MQVRTHYLKLFHRMNHFFGKKYPIDLQAYQK